MKRFDRLSGKIMFWRLLAVVLFAASFGVRADIDMSDSDWPPEVVPLDIFWTRDFFWPQAQFPVSSEDGKEVAVLYGGLYFDGDRSIILDAYDVPGREPRIRHVLQHRNEDFSLGLANGRLLQDRIGMVNRYLMAKSYEPMRPFFRLEYDPAPAAWPVACFPHARCEFHSQSPGDPERPPAQAHFERRSIQFDFQAGVLRIGSVRAGERDSDRADLQLHWPVTESRPAQGDPRRDCRIQAVPREAWIGNSPRKDGKRVLLLRIGFLVEEMACLQPDEWRVELLPR